MTSTLGRDTARPITPHSILVAQLQKTLRMTEESNIPLEILTSLRQGLKLAADSTSAEDQQRIILDSGLLAADGLICVDNTLLQGQVYLASEQVLSSGIIHKLIVIHFPRIIRL